MSARRRTSIPELASVGDDAPVAGQGFGLAGRRRERQHKRSSGLGLRALLAAVVFSACAWSPLWAEGPQGAGAPPEAKEAGRPRSFQISFGADWLMPETVGTTAATMTTNATGGGTTTFFTNKVTRTAAPAFRGRVGYTLTRMVTIEGGFLVSQGTVEDAVSGDAEQAPAVTIGGNSITQYFVDVSVLVRYHTFASGAGVAFLEAGGGYLRQMHEGNVAVDTGQIYHFGNGVIYMFTHRRGSRPTGVGLRADAQLYVRHKGFSVGGSTQGVFVAVGAGLVVAF
jgi:hypothetical protein